MSRRVSGALLSVGPAGFHDGSAAWQIGLKDTTHQNPPSKTCAKLAGRLPYHYMELHNLRISIQCHGVYRANALSTGGGITGGGIVPRIRRYE
jgi:hypothetical protein